jgi:hypothetical protein
MKRFGRCPVMAFLAALLSFAGAPRVRAFLGFADTSFVTVIANPAEAADWASELESLNQQLAAAQNTLQTVDDLRAFAGDPRAAVAALRDLADVSGALSQLSAAGQTEAELEEAWQALDATARLAQAAGLLKAAGPGTAMQVFGQTQPRDPGLYTGLAQEEQAAQDIRRQVAQEQAARKSVAAELALAWSQFRSAPTESSKQAILAEISQLQSQDQVMDARRRALLDDLELSDREDRSLAGVRAKAADERRLAESALLNANDEARVRDAEAQRLATLQKTSSDPAAPDYGGLRLWTTADADGNPP